MSVFSYRPAFRGPDPVEPDYGDDGGRAGTFAFNRTNMRLITITIYR
jgi:hypothetical protein